MRIHRLMLLPFIMAFAFAAFVHDCLNPWDRRTDRLRWFDRVLDWFDDVTERAIVWGDVLDVLTAAGIAGALWWLFRMVL